tara:strand:- start:56 stop:760 length:705 start_codon:yes stop_codon:yes gene_type:complete
MKLKRLAIIPARGGSKRIKNKNIKNFLGKPIISYSIKTAFKSKLFSKIHVSTEDKMIKKVSENYGIKFDFMRPKSLAEDHIGLLEVLKFVVNKYHSLNDIYDEAWLIMPCSPLIESSDLIKASKIYKKQNSKKILMAISEYNAPIEWSYRMNKKNFLSPLFPKMISKDSKKIIKKYYDSGTFAVYNFLNLKNKNNYNGKYIGYIIKKDKAIDIDDKVDWNIAESIYKNRKKINE